MPIISSDQSFLLYGLIFIFGLAAGSFLNVVIYRLPRKMSLTKPRSSCPQCGGTIPWHLNIPVFSYLVLLGRCRHCGTTISPRYPLVEAGTAGFFLLLFWRDGLTVTTAGHWFLSATLVVVFFIDLEWSIIPDFITLPGILLGLVLSLVGGHRSIVFSAIGIIAGGGSFFMLAVVGHALFKKESLGGGDIKLAAMLGAFLGPTQVLVVFVISAILGLVISLIGIFISVPFRKERRLPFGPFLVVATFLIIFFGQEITDWYTGAFLNP